MKIKTYQHVTEFLTHYEALIQKNACAHQIFLEALQEAMSSTTNGSLIFGALHDSDGCLIFYNDFPYNL